MIKAKIILDSINPSGDRITTGLWTYPRFIHSEIMTHRMQACALANEIPFDDGSVGRTPYYGCFKGWKPYRKFFQGENKTADLHALLASKPDWVKLVDET